MAVHPIQRVLHSTRFLTSAQHLHQCPEEDGVEVAFAGRSNAGKSSAINKLTGQRQLARTSKTPGRTQLINFFSVDDSRRLVDLPGYGYAKVDKATRNQWQRDLDEYLAKRKTLEGLVLLMDIRHPLKDYDQMLVDWSACGEMPLHILLTKSDKLKYGAAKQALQKTRNALKGHPAPLTIQLFSATEPRGLETAWDKIGEWLQIPVDQDNPQAGD